MKVTIAIFLVILIITMMALCRMSGENDKYDEEWYD